MGILENSYIFLYTTIVSFKLKEFSKKSEQWNGTNKTRKVKLTIGYNRVCPRFFTERIEYLQFEI